MSEAASTTTFDALRYLSPDELSRLIERFDCALQDVTCLVFWTGLSPALVRLWAEQHELQTLTRAMGPLYSCRDAGSPRYGKSLKAWSKYMKGACGLFAGYACRDRRVIVLTNPPPNIYSKRACSNYRDLEEPILKGVNTNRGTTRIDLVHPTVSGAAAFHYQVWPNDKSSDWFTFLKELAIRGLGAINTRYRVVQGDKIRQEKDMHGVLMLTGNDGSTNGSYIAAPNVGGSQIQEINRAPVRGAVKREVVEVEGQALTKKEVKRRKVEMEQKEARERKKRKEAKRKEAEMEQKKARVRKEAKRKEAEMKQKEARERKEAKRKEAEMEEKRVSLSIC